MDSTVAVLLLLMAVLLGAAALLPAVANGWALDSGPAMPHPPPAPVVGRR